MNIGFYLLDVVANNTQHQDILKSINELCKLRPYDNIVLFNNKFDAIDMDHKYYTLHISEAKYFKGILFVFDIKSAMLTKTFPAPKKQLLYLTEPEWASKKQIPYTFWSSIYNNNDFELISSNEDLYELCNICWKTPIDNIEKLNGDMINNLVQKLSLE
tara:strand:- start:287 stop:763 length:477 start_codon:yes stop_codon:yes gene_type:complete